MERIGKHTVKLNEGICVQEIRSCLLCNSEGVLLYQDLRDRLFDAPGIWHFLTCPRCGLVWLNPRPISEDIGKIYATYHTHFVKSRKSRMASLRKKIKYTLLAAVFGYDDLLEWKGSKWIGRILSLLTPLKEMERLSIMCLEGSRKGRLLDVGYGSGFFLSTMQDLGWEVLGIEPDVQAANIAKEQFKVPVIVSTLEEVRLPASSFDAITMNHVIEHVPDPLGVLKECQRLLKPNGILVVTTPNFGSLGHRLFRQRWRGLEVPRHFYLFRTRTMLMIAEKAGFFVKSLTTSARFARGMFVASLFPSLEKRRNKPRVRYILHLFGLGFYALEAFIRYSLAPNIGEELVLIAEPRKEGKCLYISR